MICVPLPTVLDDPAALWAHLRPLGEVVGDAAPSEHRRWFDTFDWRLWRAGRGLAHDGDSWRLDDLAAGTTLAAEPAWSRRWPRFATDFPAGPLRDALADLLDVRALIHLVTADRDVVAWRLLNEDGKTVLAGTLEAHTFARPAPATPGGPVRWLTLAPLRGYEEQAEAALSLLAGHGLAATNEPAPAPLLRAAGLVPAGYGAKFEADLEPAMSAREAFVAISRRLVRTMRQNEAGVAADVDTEFLHDFRVALRRQRSALAIFRGVLPPLETAAFAGEFRTLQQLTGPLRDTDVHLLDESRYRGLVPAPLQPGLDGMFERLRQQRAGELEAVRTTLASQAYRQLLASWLSCLAGEASGPGAGEPVLALARRRLKRRHRRLLRDGKRIDAHSPDTDLHRLRIQGKKLRYLLEFFASLLDRDEVAALVAPLKVLQDNLGAYNDLSVQTTRLEADLARLAAARGRSQASAAEAAALGGLLTALDRERRRVRKQFQRTFAAFAHRDVKARFKRLIADPAAPADPADPADTMADPPDGAAAGGA